MKIKENQAKINEVFTSQSFGNVEETPVRTAYEMSVRENNMQQTTHSAYGRLQSEFLEKILQRIVYILSNAGKIPPLRINGHEITIKFTSPAARIQDAEELESLYTWKEYMADVPMELINAKIKTEDIPQFVANRTGLPASLLRNAAEEEIAVKKMDDARKAGMQAETDAAVPDVLPPTQ